MIILVLKASRGNHTSWKSKLATGVYGALNMAMYILGILVSFTPSLGLMNTLRHYQADRIPFANKAQYTY